MFLSLLFPFFVSIRFVQVFVAFRFLSPSGHTLNFQFHQDERRIIQRSVNLPESYSIPHLTHIVSWLHLFFPSKITVVLSKCIYRPKKAVRIDVSKDSGDSSSIKEVSSAYSDSFLESYLIL